MTAGMVTAIFPVFDRPAHLGEAAESMLAQTHRPIEIIVVDDSSSAHTLEVADAHVTAVGSPPGFVDAIVSARRMLSDGLGPSNAGSSDRLKLTHCGLARSAALSAQQKAATAA